MGGCGKEFYKESDIGMINDLQKMGAVCNCCSKTKSNGLIDYCNKCKGCYCVFCGGLLVTKEQQDGDCCEGCWDNKSEVGL